MPHTFPIQSIVSLDYDDLNQDRYRPGTFIGMVITVDGDRMKVLYCDDNQTDFCWLKRHTRNRWIDVTYGAIVSVEEATVAQREYFHRRVPPEKQK